MIRVHKPGFQTTIQDGGRYGYSHLGISISGAADPVAFKMGNLLLGNDLNAPALEITLVGPAIEFEHDALISLTGSDLHPVLDGEALAMWRTWEIRAGQILTFGGTSGGARCYLGVRGGWIVDPVLGSASTHLLTSLGGLSGRALRSGDTLSHPGLEAKGFMARRVFEEIVAEWSPRSLLRVTAAPQTDWFDQDALNLLVSQPYLVSEESNRMGLRLQGPALLKKKTGDLITEGALLGAVQVSSEGQPIILFVEHQTTGGYPKIANVISADWHRLGQLRPRDLVRFQFMPIEEAWAARARLEALIATNPWEPV